jgi:hypothetical protein
LFTILYDTGKKIEKQEFYLPFDCVFHWNLIKEYFTLFIVLSKAKSKFEREQAVELSYALSPWG